MATSQRPLMTMAEGLVSLAQELAAYVAVEMDAEAQASASSNGWLTSKKLLQIRRQRTKYLPTTLFHEPAWDILLALHSHQADMEPLTMKQVSSEVGTPFTTTQRWVEHMVQAGLLIRTECERDRRRVELTLSSECRQRLDNYFAAVQLQ